MPSEPAWHPRAAFEAAEARGWYAERSPAAAHAFAVALDQAIDAIVEHPDRWPVHRHGCRRYVLPRQFPYSVVFRLREAVEIVAVAHDKRRPGYWRHR